MSSYELRSTIWQTISRDQWSDWRWHQQNSVRSVSQLKQVFPSIADEQLTIVEAGLTKFRMSLTPHILTLMHEPLSLDLLWRQFTPSRLDPTDRPDRFDGERENWETKQEFLTPILHWKYPDRAILRVRNDCLSYCSFCLQSLRVLDVRHPKPQMKPSDWERSMMKLRDHPQITDAIISGGEPLLLPNEILEELLADLRSIPSIETIRLHTRALSFNPFRVTSELARILRQYRVTEIALHVAHSQEVGDDFLSALQGLYEARPVLIVAQIPLLRTINDSADELMRLFRLLYRHSVKPYYLIHCMPFVQGASTFRTSVRQGVELMSQIKRVVSNVAVPEYILVHETGKKTVPEEPEGTSRFRYGIDKQGWPIVDFQNWKGDRVEYLDSP